MCELYRTKPWKLGREIYWKLGTLECVLTVPVDLVPSVNWVFTGKPSKIRGK